MGTASLAIVGEPPVVKADAEFDELYELYSHAVYLTAIRVTGDAADAEDVLQNVFLRVLNSGAAIDPVRSPATYFRQAATNASIDLLRRKQARPDRRRSAIEFDESSNASSQQSSPLLKQRLRQALTRIATEDAELFVLCYLEGCTYDELAGLTGLERGTVASRLHRIRAALKEELSK